VSRGVGLRAAMRKKLKKKRRSCRLCKPHKMGIENRWKPKEEQALRVWEREKKSLTNE
jgi:hypothetical protein